MTNITEITVNADKFALHKVVEIIRRCQGSSELSERSVRFKPNLRSERVQYFSERETNLQAIKRLISL